MESVNKGNLLYVEEKYDEAFEEFTTAIAQITGPKQFPALFGRARTLMHLDKYSNAINDFGQCLSFNHKHQLTNYYLGLCLMKMAPDDIEKMKLSHKYLCIATEGQLTQPRFETQWAKAGNILQELQPKSEIINGNTNTKDSEMKTQNTNTNTDERPTASTKIRESWYQTETDISFTLYAKNLSAKDVSIKFGNQMVLIQLQLRNEQTFRRYIQLRKEIKRGECSYALTKYKLNILLIKATNGNWDRLEESLVSDTDKKSMFKGPYSSKRNWGEVQKKVEQELQKDKPEGNDALQSMFSKIYGDADDDQKRAMVKSFQTSGGTVLSTNWKDVKDKDYEGKDKVLPTGQNAEKYEY